MEASQASITSPFDIIRETLTVNKRDLTEEELKAYSPIFINRLVSMMGENFVPLANALNRYIYKGMTPEQHHRFLQEYLPSRKMFVKYIKKPKDVDNYRPAIMIYFKCGSRDADEIMVEMSEEEMRKIRDELKKAGFLDE